MAVQRNPNLFDGVIARAPAYNWVGFMGAFNRTAKALAAPGGAFSPAKTALLAKHVRDACDGLDGIVDGVVSNPAACTATVLNVAALRCAGGADTGDTCLSDAQLAVVNSWTTDAVFRGSSTFRSRGYNLTGNEDDPGGFGIWVSGNGNVLSAGQYAMQDSTVKYYFARDPNADSLVYSPWDQNQNALYAMAALNDATQTDIRPFINNGGKLIVWHGGSDAALSVNSTIEYMANMQKSVGEPNAGCVHSILRGAGCQSLRRWRRSGQDRPADGAGSMGNKGHRSGHLDCTEAGCEWGGDPHFAVVPVSAVPQVHGTGQ